MTHKEITNLINKKKYEVVDGLTGKVVGKYSTIVAAARKQIATMKDVGHDLVFVYDIQKDYEDMRSK